MSDSALESSVEATREPSFLLAKPEKRLLRWVAARLPRWVLPDDLTALGVLAALGVAVAYQLSNDSLDWLWVASALLVLQWFGDSLDGTLARVRGIERPTYGYYLDHLVDAIATAAIGIGLGLSPLMLLSIGTLIVVAYLILSINVYLESFAFGRFSIGYGYVGPTEIRLILIALNTVVALGAGLDFVVADLQLTVFDLIGLAIATTMIVLLVARAGRNLHELARKEPSARRKVGASFPQIAGMVTAHPLTPPSRRNKLHLRFGKEEDGDKAKSHGPLEGDRQSFDRAKATHEAGSAASPPGRIFFALFVPARSLEHRPTAALPSALRHGQPPARDGLPPRVARPGRLRGASAEVGPRNTASASPPAPHPRAITMRGVATVSGLDPAGVADVGRRLADNIKLAVKVGDAVVRDVLVALFAEGHVLIEDYPGVGKTALARALAARSTPSTRGSSARRTCSRRTSSGPTCSTSATPASSSTPAPCSRTSCWSTRSTAASPKTQSGLLECMQERHVTVDGHQHELARPFVVIATQNPAEYEGTYPLPEAQLDRFMVRVSLGYPDAVARGGDAGRARRLTIASTTSSRSPTWRPCWRRRPAAAAVHGSEALRRYAVALAEATRARYQGRAGREPARAVLMLFRAAKALAALDGRDHVSARRRAGAGAGGARPSPAAAPEAAPGDATAVIADALERVPAL